MSTCPLCQKDIQADQADFEYHVNSHLDEPTSSSSQLPITTRKRTWDEQSDLTECPICSFPFLDTPRALREQHVYDCLDGPNRERYETDTRTRKISHTLPWEDGTMQSAAQKNTDNWVSSEWDGPAKPGGWSDWVSKKPGTGDRWWDPIAGVIDSKVPSNFSPGALTALRDVLMESAKQYTLKVRLCSETTHIRHSWRLDTGWGCGYRNALMCISALVYNPAYREVLSREKNGAEPGVRRVQGWIEEAWNAGYDREGAAQLNGKVLGTRKWIGPTDLYAMFSFLGIPCELYDFPKPVKRDPHEAGSGKKNDRKASHALVDWVKRYFDEEHALPSYTSGNQVNAFNVMMENGSKRKVQQTERLPLILQHKGHSRTIVGYEETHRGTNLLLFDPGRSTPSDIRNAGLEIAKRNQPRMPSLYPVRKASHQSSHESLQFSRPYTNGNSEPVFLPPIDSPDILDDEEVSPDGWVRKKVNKLKKSINDDNGTGKRERKQSVPQILVDFRVSVERLGKFDQYQVLRFTGGPVMSMSERSRRKVITSRPIRADDL